MNDNNVHNETNKQKMKKWQEILITIFALCIFVLLLCLIMWMMHPKAIDTSDDPAGKYDNYDEWFHNALSGKSRQEMLSAETVLDEICESKAESVMVDDYAYFIQDGKIAFAPIESLKSDSYGSTDINHTEYQSIDFPATMIVGSETRLFASYCYNYNTEDHSKSTVIHIYDVSSPNEPKLIKEYDLLGDKITAFAHNGDFYVFTADMLPVCGFSRSNDLGVYYPQLLSGGKEIKWTDSEIGILGDPHSLHYVTMVKFDSETGEVAEKHAYYGDVTRMYCGEDWFVFETTCAYHTPKKHSEFYTFDISDEFEYTGKISPSLMLNANIYQALDRSGKAISSVVNIRMITKVNGVYRLLGTCNSSKDLFLSAVDMESGEYSFETIEDYPIDRIRETIDDEEKTIIITQTLKETITDEKTNRTNIYEDNLLTISYSGTEISVGNTISLGLTDNRELISDHLPLCFKLPNDILIRYNYANYGLDVYDISDPMNPKCLQRTLDEFSESQYQTGNIIFQNAVEIYSDNSFGIVVYDTALQMLSWHIYSVDGSSESPLTVKSQQPIWDRSEFTDIPEFEITCYKHNEKLFFFVANKSDMHLFCCE